MIRFWFIVYNVLLLPSFWLVVKFCSLFNAKITEGFRGRKLTKLFLDNYTPDNNKKRVIIHSSSLGEFQQAIPLIEELNKLNYDIIVSFFSPSGYSNAKLPFDNIKKIYLPFDFPVNIKNFFNRIKPDYVFLVRYELWFNFLYYAYNRDVKTILINARYDENDKCWKIPLVKSFKKTPYRFVKKIFVIDESDEKHFIMLINKYENEIIKVGDSKYERVYKSSLNIKRESVVNTELIRDRKVFVIGSSWKEDEEMILPALNRILESEKSLLTFLVPHEPKETKIKAIEENMSNKYPNIRHIRFSGMENYTDENLIIVDSVGKLQNLYSIAYISYVGGGFGSGLHNILEPAIFNIPVLFNNEEKNSDEDEIFIRYGCGIVVSTTEQFYKIFKGLLDNRELRDAMGSRCKKVFEQTLGTARKIVEYLNL